MELHERLKICRAENNYTQKEVADIIGVDVTTYAHYESGRRSPDIKRLQVLCNLFNISIEEHFPLIRNLQYPPEMIEDLKRCKKDVEDEFNKLSHEDISKTDSFERTKCLLNKLKVYIEPVQKIWENTMSTPDMELDGLESGQTIARINFNPDEWQLLSDSIKLQSKLVAFMLN